MVVHPVPNRPADPADLNEVALALDDQLAADADREELRGPHGRHQPCANIVNACPRRIAVTIFGGTFDPMGFLQQ